MRLLGAAQLRHWLGREARTPRWPPARRGKPPSRRRSLSCCRARLVGGSYWKPSSSFSPSTSSTSSFFVLNTTSTTAPATHWFLGPFARSLSPLVLLVGSVYLEFRFPFLRRSSARRGHSAAFLFEKKRKKQTKRERRTSRAPFFAQLQRDGRENIKRYCCGTLKLQDGALVSFKSYKPPITSHSSRLFFFSLLLVVHSSTGPRLLFEVLPLDDRPPSSPPPP